jgi:hypothetical protein
MNNYLFHLVYFSCLLVVSVGKAQKVEKYNLSKLLNEGKLIYGSNQQVNTIDEAKGPGVTISGIVLLKDVVFSAGSIDVDIRGKDVFQQSFLGIAFHALDTVTYDAIYFRPFNFQTTDALRRQHMVQYISQPDYPWDTLRKDHPLVYEHAVIHPPSGAEWFHAHIVVTKDGCLVYVNYSTSASLSVKRLNNRHTGSIGLWSSFLSGDFANLIIKTDK